MIILVGFMGAGKSTVGRALAQRLGVPFTDTDETIEADAGMTVAQIFETRGESGFRELEREAVEEVLAKADGVVALGGGALGDPATRSALGERDDVTVVHLDVSFEEALRRIGGDGTRPMLAAADPRALHDVRRAAYEGAAGFTVATDGRGPEEIAHAIEARVSSGPSVRSVTVAASGGSYEVVVGRDLLGSAAAHVPGLERAEKAFVITHPHLRDLADAVCEGLGVTATVLEVAEGEASKSLDVARDLYVRLAQSSAHRRDVVVAVGGGVVTDLAGFVASTFNRGMPVLHVPTSLLAQVDAAIGGKTGVNLAEGKNLVGTFHQPLCVLCDVAALRTLPDQELRFGMAEVVKYGLIADPALLELVTARAPDVAARDEELLAEIVARSAAIKAEVVAADEREVGRRAVLNYGHTFAHAFEQTTGYGVIRHGEAVAVGMMAAAWLGRILGRIDDDAVAGHRRALEALGLPTTTAVDHDRLERAWTRDKKYDRGVRFVLLSRIGHAEWGITAPRDAVAEALSKVAE